MTSELDDRFPAIAAWIRDGSIEIGDQEFLGCGVTAHDCGGLAFQDHECRTLTECLESLERGLRAHMKERWGDEFE